MNILVYGAGAVGSFIGARLVHAGHKVTLVLRPEAAAAINAVGLSVQIEQQQIVTRPTAVATLRQALMDDQQYDALLLTMKAYDTNRALDELIAFYPNPPLLITLQNGIGIESKFVDQFGAERVIGGSVTIPISIDATNAIIVEKSGRGLGLAPTLKKQRIDEWVELFRTAGIDTTGFADYQGLKWSKAFVNIIANATVAILNRHPRVIYRNPVSYNIEKQMLREALAVMRRLKIPVYNLPGSPARRLALALRFLPGPLLQPILSPIVSQGRGDKMPSFYLDLTRGKTQNEVVYHNGAIAKIGRENGLDVPVNSALNDVLMALARGEREWETYSGNPRRLAQDVAEYRQATRQRPNG